MFNSLIEFLCPGTCLDNILHDNDVEILVRALAGHIRLARIDLTGSIIGKRGMTALAALLNNSHSSLTEVVLSQCILDDDGAGILAAALARNGTLRRLDLGNLSKSSNVTVTGWSALFTQLQSSQSSLEELVIGTTGCHDTEW